MSHPTTWVFARSTEPRPRFEGGAAGSVTAMSLSNSEILGVKFMRSER
jgi:hypothetical protein